jgi:hypothetical protein
MRMPELISRYPGTQSALIIKGGDRTPKGVARHPLEAAFNAFRRSPIPLSAVT